ncbi:uncharacterized protein LOC119726637 isoform X2 [Patiria miniata]|uniref:3'-5' exonuclease domain-containing protein n=1 Tax=Patiria miniata TaxID=46514 RepID=A0A913ZTC8_PATMI|nr:uncharacterized protein LOC119726637 isoform X2 [Patiria miniata]
MAYFREASPYRLEDVEKISGEHSEVLEVGDKWAVVSVADYSRAMVFKGALRRGNLAPIRKMGDYLRPGFNVIIEVRRLKRGDIEPRRHGCGWVVTKITREELMVSPAYYRDAANLFDFMGTKGKRRGQARPREVDGLGAFTGEAVQLIRSFLTSWNGISLSGIMDNLSDAHPVIKDRLDCVEDLSDFLEGQPRFFTVTSQGFVYLNGGHEANCVQEEIKSRLPRLDVGIFGDEAVIIRKPWRVGGVIKPIIRDEETRVVAFDTERASNGDCEYLSTVQIAIIDAVCPQAYIFDVIDWSDRDFKTSKLKHLLESKRVLKVVHDCRGDSAALENYGIELTNVFDTAVAYTTIMEQSNVRYTPPPNFTQLCNVFGRFTPQRNSKNVYQGNRNFWASRPLTDNMIDHAASDVMGLATNVYDNMTSFMNPAWKSRFNALCTKSLGH